MCAKCRLAGDKPLNLEEQARYQYYHDNIAFVLVQTLAAAAEVPVTDSLIANVLGHWPILDLLKLAERRTFKRLSELSTTSGWIPRKDDWAA